MSVETITQFFQQEGQDPFVQQQLQSASDRNTLANLIVDIGQQKGYSFTPTEAQEWIDSTAAQMESRSNTEGELNDEELESVAGGFTPFAPLAILVTGVLTRGAVKVAKETIKN